MTHETKSVIDAGKAVVNAGHALCEEIFSCIPPGRRAEWQAHTAAGSEMIVTVKWALGRHIEVRVGLLVDDPEVPQLVWGRDFDPLDLSLQGGPSAG